MPRIGDAREKRKAAVVRRMDANSHVGRRGFAMLPIVAFIMIVMVGKIACSSRCNRATRSRPRQ
jgi:hypothetical protein